MKRGEIIKLIKRAAQNRELVFSNHALDEMASDGESRPSIAAVLEAAKTFTRQPNGRWRVHHRGVTVIIQIQESEVVVWTVFV